MYLIQDLKPPFNISFHHLEVAPQDSNFHHSKVAARILVSII